MKKYISMILGGLMMASCVDTVILPYDKTVDEDFWQTKEDVNQMVLGSYVKMSDKNFIQRMIVWGDFRSDELLLEPTINNGTKEALREIEEVNIETTNSFSDWSTVYSVINNCNIVLEKAENVMMIDPNYTEGDYLTDRSQMLAMRAMCYFYLVRAFRDVPYSNQAYMNSSQDMTIRQLSPDSVLINCIADLEEAEKNALAAVAGDKEHNKINKEVIHSILADIYLWRASVMRNPADYEKCIEYCDMVIASKNNTYQPDGMQTAKPLYPMTNNAFRAYQNLYQTYQSNEIIFQILPADNKGVQEMYSQYKKDGGTGYVKASAIFGSNGTTTVYDKANDMRYLLNTYGVGSGASSYAIRKYIATNQLIDVTTGIPEETPPSYDEKFENNYIFYRLTDVMLMKAEALSELAVDKSDVRLRNAFNIVQYVNNRSFSESAKSDSLKWNTYADKTKMENLILAERLRELCFEGKRWYDLLRYNYRHVDGIDYTSTLAEQAEQGADFVVNYKEMLSLVIRKYSEGADARRAKMRTEPHLYMPIPRSDMEVASYLKQNPAYSDNDRFEQND